MENVDTLYDQATPLHNLGQWLLNFLVPGLLILLKMTEDTKEILLMQMISIDNCLVGNLIRSWLCLKSFNGSLVSTRIKPTILQGPDNLVPTSSFQYLLSSHHTLTRENHLQLPQHNKMVLSLCRFPSFCWKHPFPSSLPDKLWLTP